MKKLLFPVLVGCGLDAVRYLKENGVDRDQQVKQNEGRRYSTKILRRKQGKLVVISNEVRKWERT